MECINNISNMVGQSISVLTVFNSRVVGIYKLSFYKLYREGGFSCCKINKNDYLKVMLKINSDS